MTQRKLIPALYELAQRGILRGVTSWVLRDLKSMNDESFRAMTRAVIDAMPFEPERPDDGVLDACTISASPKAVKNSAQDSLEKSRNWRAATSFPGTASSILALPPW